MKSCEAKRNIKISFNPTIIGGGIKQKRFYDVKTYMRARSLSSRQRAQQIAICKASNRKLKLSDKEKA